MADIRRATPNDLEILVPLLRSIQMLHVRTLPDRFVTPVADEPYYSRLSEILGDVNALGLIAERDSMALGMATAYRRISAPNPMQLGREQVYIDSLVVRPECRRQGIGRALVQAIEQWAKERGAEEVVLDVWEFNREAVAAYRALGFETLIRRMTRPLT